MLLNHILLITLLSCLGLHSPGAAQDQERLKKGVVRIENRKLKQSGTGFIVALDKDKLYIVTASHVVSGSSDQDVYFFSNQHRPVRATVIGMEENELEGIAVLLVTKGPTQYSDLISLPIAKASSFQGGENIQVIGFPGGTRLWTISNASVERIDGRDIVLSKRFESGTSGGPVILNGQVVGMVTNAKESTSSAVLAESITLYLEGVIGLRKTEPDLVVNQKTAVRITEIPVYDQKGSAWKFVDIAGDVTGVNPGEVRVVLYSRTTKWYIQPEQDNPFTIVGPDNKWIAQIHPGASYAALLVKSTYRLKTTEPVDHLPPVGGEILDAVEVRGKRP